MKHTIALLGSFILVSATPPASEPYKVLAVREGRDYRQVTVALRQRADFVGVPVTISSNEKDPEQRSNDIRQVRDEIVQRAKGNSTVQVLPGSVYLSAEVGPSFSKSGSPSSQTVLNVLVQLPKGQKDLYGSVAVVNRLVADIELPGKVTVSFGRALLGIDGPENYRPKLLQLIAQEIQATKVALGIKAYVAIGGLHQMVAVRQVDETDVELFIPYTFNFDAVE